MEHRCIECGSRWPGYHYVHCIAVRMRPAMTIGDWVGIGIIIGAFCIVLGLDV